MLAPAKRGRIRIGVKAAATAVVALTIAAGPTAPNAAPFIAGLSNAPLVTPVAHVGPLTSTSKETHGPLPMQANPAPGPGNMLAALAECIRQRWALFR